MLKKTGMLCALLLCLTAAGCGAGSNSADSGTALIHPDGTSEALQNLGTPAGVSSWAVYWDADNSVDELPQIKELDSLYYFAAYFDEKDRLFLPEELQRLRGQMAEEYPQAGWKSYLTIVNDRLLPDGSSSDKDVPLLYRLLGSPAAMQAHADAIVALALSNEFDGIEIDYESIRNDSTLWGYFLSFCETLWKKAVDAGLLLRVTLESTTPFDKLFFPAGPAYAVMCYNLYGGHSGPGPKADSEFLKQVEKRAASLPGGPDFALAAGGFDWPEEGRAASLTEQKADALLEQTGAKARRDAASGCLVFDYTDKDGFAHTVWYADAETLNGWREVLAAEGARRFSLWRLGGNTTLPALSLGGSTD